MAIKGLSIPVCGNYAATGNKTTYSDPFIADSAVEYGISWTTSCLLYTSFLYSCLIIPAFVAGCFNILIILLQILLIIGCLPFHLLFQWLWD